MSWQDQATSMINHGAQFAGVYSYAGDVWGQVNMEKVSKQEVEKLVSTIRSGGGEMTIQGKGCIVTQCTQGQSITGKAKAEKEGDERPLWHVVLGKTNCLYMAGCCGANERCVVEVLENKFAFLKEY